MEKSKGKLEYGKVFKRIREQKNYKQSSFESLEITKSTISNFENGRHMMSIDKVDSCLRLMKTPLREYEYLLNNLSLDYYENILREIEIAVFERNFKELSKIQANNRFDRMIFLAAKAEQQKLSGQEQEEIFEYFSQAEYWGYYEIGTLSSIINSVNAEIVLDIMDFFWDKNVKYYKILRYRRKILQTAYRATVSLISHKYKEEARRILDVAKGELTDFDMHSRLTHQFVEGYFTFIFKDKKKGKEEMLRTLDIFESLGASLLLKGYQLFCEEVF